MYLHNYVTAILILNFASGTIASADEKSQEAAPVKIDVVKAHAAPEPHAPKPEAPDVMNALEAMVKAYSQGDVQNYAKGLDDQCSVYDSQSKQMITGKAAVEKHITGLFSKHAPGGQEPLTSYTIDHPYTKVTGNNAVVTYRALQQIGGSKPSKFERLTTNVFTKDGDQWKLVYERGDWQPVKAEAK